MGADYDIVDSENVDHVAEQSENALFMRLEDLNTLNVAPPLGRPERDGPGISSALSVVSSRGGCSGRKGAGWSSCRW